MPAALLVAPSPGENNQLGCATDCAAAPPTRPSRSAAASSRSLPGSPSSGRSGLDRRRLPHGLRSDQMDRGWPTCCTWACARLARAEQPPPQGGATAVEAVESRRPIALSRQEPLAAAASPKALLLLTAFVAQFVGPAQVGGASASPSAPPTAARDQRCSTRRQKLAGCRESRGPASCARCRYAEDDPAARGVRAVARAWIGLGTLQPRRTVGVEGMCIPRRDPGGKPSTSRSRRRSRARSCSGRKARRTGAAGAARIASPTTAHAR